MPFDALVGFERRTLAEALDRLAISPVSWQALENHKSAQLARFAPSFWHAHQTWLPIGLVGSVGCMAASGGLANRMAFTNTASLLTLAWMGVIGLLIVFGVFRAHGGAEWKERIITPYALRHVPPPIAAFARDLLDELPDAALVLGELKRQEVVLDPYLLLEHDGGRVCLGIWDGPRVIEQCQQRNQGDWQWMTMCRRRSTT
jgi:hypothetical protein